MFSPSFSLCFHISSEKDMDTDGGDDDDDEGEVDGGSDSDTEGQQTMDSVNTVVRFFSELRLTELTKTIVNDICSGVMLWVSENHRETNVL